MSDERIPNWDDGGPTPFDEAARFREWIHTLDEDVIQGEYGYEPGEFTIFAEHWHEHYTQGLTPAQSFKRPLDAFAEDRRQRAAAKAVDWERIKAADATSRHCVASAGSSANSKTAEPFTASPQDGDD